MGSTRRAPAAPAATECQPACSSHPSKAYRRAAGSPHPPRCDHSSAARHGATGRQQVAAMPIGLVFSGKTARIDPGREIGRHLRRRDSAARSAAVVIGRTFLGAACSGWSRVWNCNPQVTIVRAMGSASRDNMGESPFESDGTGDSPAAKAVSDSKRLLGVASVPTQSGHIAEKRQRKVRLQRSVQRRQRNMRATVNKETQMKRFAKLALGAALMAGAATAILRRLRPASSSAWVRRLPGAAPACCDPYWAFYNPYYCGYGPCLCRRTGDRFWHRRRLPRWLPWGGKRRRHLPMVAASPVAGGTRRPSLNERCKKR